MDFARLGVFPDHDGSNSVPSLVGIGFAGFAIGGGEGAVDRNFDCEDATVRDGVEGAELPPHLFIVFSYHNVPYDSNTDFISLLLSHVMVGL